MNILALDTCFGACSAAVSGHGRVLSSAFELRQTGHAEALLPMVEHVMACADLSFAHLDRIVVTAGPGSFTGMRIGIAAARALSLVTGALVIGVPTLAAMAETALRNPEVSGRLLVAVDARKDQIYVQMFDDAQSSEATAAVMSPQEVAGLMTQVPLGVEVFIVGSGAQIVADHLSAARSNVNALQFDLQPNAAHIFDLALRIEAGLDRTIPFPVRPLYLRPPDAKPQHGKSIPRLS